MTKITCDDCGSIQVVETCLDPPKEPEYTMTGYSKRPMFKVVNAVMTYYNYALTCLDCGHRIEYTR